eukprot:TRINITY_DN3389_c0_g1_i1.p1 TRINITY_DN3389_c0_g1~~TRINITY_DN3389_c0_g1_i1.p1  ORF type:complete len:236 (-),score=20.23 TRINITY_DN3389_c0_g1_i1:7-714(-)
MILNFKKSSIFNNHNLIGSAFWGGVMIVFSFTRVLAIWGSVAFAILIIITLWWARKNWVPLVVTILFLIILFGLMSLGFAGVDYRVLGVRLYIGFLGMLSCMYSTFDIWEDTIKSRKNQSDAAQLALLFNNKINSRVIGFFWGVFSVLVFLCAVIIGLLLNDIWDEEGVNPTPWTDGSPDVDEVWDGMPVDLFIILFLFPILAFICFVSMITCRILWGRGIIKNDIFDKRKWKIK